MVSQFVPRRIWNLIGSFKGPSIPTPGVGISFGVTRISAILAEIKKLEIEEKSPVLVCVMDKKYLAKYYEILNEMRSNRISSEIFLNPDKNMGKQLTYASKRKNSVAVICGENEFKDETVTLKNLFAEKGDKNLQVTVPRKDLINEVRKIISKNN